MSRAPIAAGAKDAEASQTQVRSPWLLAARIAWPVFIFGVLTIPYARALPNFYAAYLHACDGDCSLSSGAALALVHLGISLKAYAWLATGLTLALLVSTTTMGCILCWRARDLITLLTGAFILIIPGFVGAGASLEPTSEVSTTLPAQIDNPPILIASLLRFVLLFAMFYLFPSGRFIPRWSWALFVFSSLLYSVLAADLLPIPSWLALFAPLFILVAIGCQMYRYRRISSPTQRQQTKWVVIGFAAFILGHQLFWLPVSFTPLGQTLYMPAAWLLYLFAVNVLPITLFIAIQRYHLFEIDRIINKALVYGLLTGILAILFVGGVIGLQTIVRTLTGQDSPVALVASTLLIAGLFQPLRSRIQKTIDRRFYRAKYDAQKTLATFSATLRQEVSLSELQTQLLAVVEQTMQPERLLLWIAPRATDQTLASADAPPTWRETPH